MQYLRIPFLSPPLPRTLRHHIGLYVPTSLTSEGCRRSRDMRLSKHGDVSSLLLLLSIELCKISRLPPAVASSSPSHGIARAPPPFRALFETVKSLNPYITYKAPVWTLLTCLLYVCMRLVRTSTLKNIKKIWSLDRGSSYIIDIYCISRQLRGAVCRGIRYDAHVLRGPRRDET